MSDLAIYEDFEDEDDPDYVPQPTEDAISEQIERTRALLAFSGSDERQQLTPAHRDRAYLRLVERRGEACSICGLEPKPKKRLMVDHCHKTGAVRGLLCGKCNSGIGFFNDDIAVLKLAIKYLRLRRT